MVLVFFIFTFLFILLTVLVLSTISIKISFLKSAMSRMGMMGTGKILRSMQMRW